MKYRTARNAEIVSRHWGKSLEQDKWFDISGKDDETPVIRIYDVIGWPWIDADTFVGELSEIKSERAKLKINTPGGDVFDGTAIYNELKNHNTKFDVEIDGLAASMGSLIALAGDTVSIADNAWYMIHNPWSFMAGDYIDFRKEADLLERMAESMSRTYVDESVYESKVMRKMMDDETWLLGEEAVAAGFADSVTGESGDASAKFNTSVFNNTPEDIQRAAHNYKPSKRDAERALRDVGFSQTEAKALVAQANFQRDVDISIVGDLCDIDELKKLLSSNLKTLQE